MRVLLVSFYYRPEIGAAPSRIANMADGLRKQGCEVDVLTCLPNYPKGRIYDGYRRKLYFKEKEDSGKIYRYWTYATVSKNPLLRAWGMCSYALMMWAFAFKIKTVRSYDIVIVQSPPLFVSFSALLLFKCFYKKKVVLNVSDLWPLSAIELGAMRDGGMLCRIFTKIERFIYRKSDGIFGQSKEILEHISGFESPDKMFLYRNLQHYEVAAKPKSRNSTIKIVYAGLLGVAQNILGIIENVDFKKCGVEFHVYGGGNQTKEIESYIASHRNNVYYHGYVTKEKIAVELKKYDASIVPLATRIKGAVPSKIFDILPVGIPVLFCGGGEGARIVNDYGVGFVSEPGDYEALRNNIRKIQTLSDAEYEQLSENCLKASNTDFDFDLQIIKCYEFLQKM